MTKIQKVLEEIQDLQDFYKRTKSLRLKIKTTVQERIDNNKQAEKTVTA